MFQIGQTVVRTKTGYVGVIIAIDSDTNRAQVKWQYSTKTWVKFEVIVLLPSTSEKI